MSYNLIPGKLYTTTVMDYPIVYENIESEIDSNHAVTQIYLEIGCTLLYTGKIYPIGYSRKYYEFLYHTKLIQISDLAFLILKDQ